MAKPVLGIIGGSGFYQISGIDGLKPVELTTPFGPPSDLYYTGMIGDVGLVFLSRHGRGHKLLPSEINFRANIFGMKTLGVGGLVSVSAAGSLRDELKPGDFVVPNQFIDRTHKRPSTFFGSGLVVHVSLADPVCPDLSKRLTAAARGAGANVHEGGTYLCIEGPQFSTRAESEYYRRALHADVISMTAMQEARLAREAELCYATLALVTDYDCWHQVHKEVDVTDILRVLGQNVTLAQKTIAELARGLTQPGLDCSCQSALKDAIITERSQIPRKTISELAPLLAKYLS